jgi:hypothetical protein
MSNPDESGTIETKADESGLAADERAELQALRDEKAKLEAIKHKLVEEQNAKNSKHRELKERSATMESALKELQEKYLEVSSRLEEEGKERQSLKDILAKEEAKKTLELESLKSAIPEEKRGLLVESLSVDAQLDFIKKNSIFLLGAPQPAIFPGPISRPKSADNSGLSPEEVSMISKKGIPMDVAIELKRQDPDFFIKNSKKNQ